MGEEASPCQDLLAMHEHCYSKHLSNLLSKHDDFRVSRENQSPIYDVSSKLEEMSEHEIIERSQRLEQITDSASATEQLNQAKKALNKAKFLLKGRKEMNQLPLAMLENLVPSEQKVTRNSRHVTIVISGFMSEKDDNQKEWG